MRRAIESAVAAGKPWTLDPVAAGALTFRTRFCHQILALKPAAIRGNASEILALAGMSAGGRGVDTTDTAASAVPAAQALARQTNAVVVVTGEVDYITDGQRTRTVTGGDPLMTRVVGTGCALSAVVAASCSLPGDRMDNVAAACGWMKRAGTVAVAQSRAGQFCQRVSGCALYAGGAGMKRINALTIAGTDPSGGAGIQADLKTFSALGAYGCSVITALVAQNTRGVQSVYRIEPDFVAAQLDSVFSDVRIDTTKIGMLAETDIVEAVAERLKRYQVQNVVLDTVMLAKSGDPLLSASAVETLRTKLLPQVALITPNLPEAAALLGTSHAQTEREMKAQGNALLAMGCGAVLMKGGHLDDAESPDWLFTRDGEVRFTAPRVQTKNTHGTGCTLSAALAALRPRHDGWADTVREAKTWLSAALAKADTLEVGHGIGPVHHFHAWW
jgi:hydroxymethylpyrimidine/phosphomethylpyrimidine kinase